MGAAFQTYDFTLAAGGAIQIPATGSFFRVQSATGKVNVTAEFGALKGLGVGQGARSPFRILQIQDASGSANVGTIIVGDAEFVDDRISGEVSVIDGEKSRALAGGMFSGAASIGLLPGLNSHIQLWNPAGSGKNLILNQIQIGSNVGTQYAFGFLSAPLTTDFTSTGLGNKRQGASGGAAMLKTQFNATPLMTTVLHMGYLLASANYLIPIKGAFVILPNSGMTVQNLIANTSLIGTFEWIEESQ